MNIGPHFAVAKPAILVTRHQQFAGARKFGVYLRHIARHDHRVHIGPGDQDAVNHVGRGQPQGYRPSLRKRDAMRGEHELRCNDPRRHGAVDADNSPEILLGELSREVKNLRINPLDIAWRIDVFGQGREHDHADCRGHQNTDTECPE